MKRPDGYKEWRKLFHEALNELGTTQHWYLEWRYNHLHKPGLSWTAEQRKSHLRWMTRRIWYENQRVVRIRRQLRAESEAGTSSWCEAVLDMLNLEDKP
jgi:hypothetical protein